MPFIPDDAEIRVRDRRIAQLEAVNKMLVEALEWYDACLWHSFEIVTYGAAWNGFWPKSGGEVARAALAEAKTA